MSYNDFRKRVNARLIGFMQERGKLPWQNHWIAGNARPFNPYKGIQFQGGNSLNLMYGAMERNTDDPRWMSLKEANAAGYRIRKGARGELVEYWGLKSPIANGQDYSNKPEIFHDIVFNGSDIVGFPKIKLSVAWQPNELAEQLISATGIGVRHLKEVSDSEGYGIAIYKLVRSLGNSDVPDSPFNARDELCVEIASTFLSSMVGINGNIRNCEIHVPQWIEILKEDKHELFRVAKDAERIVGVILNYSQELKERIGAQQLESHQVLHWTSFESAVKTTANRYGIPESVVIETFGFVKPRFSELIESAVDRGYEMDRTKDILVNQLVEEMRANNERNLQWEKFSSQVRKAADDQICPDQVEAALQDLHQQYLHVVREGARRGWNKEQIDKDVRSLAFGDSGRQSITSEFVKKRFFNDDQLLMPMETGFMLDDAIPFAG